MGSKGIQERQLVASSIKMIRLEHGYLTELFYRQGLSSEQYVNEIRKLTCIDEDGDIWFISPENGNWYKLVASEPVLGEPPGALYRLVDMPEGMEIPSMQKYCVQCGSPLKEGTKFCTECGKQT